MRQRRPGPARRDARGRSVDRDRARRRRPRPTASAVGQRRRAWRSSRPTARDQRDPARRGRRLHRGSARRRAVSRARAVRRKATIRFQASRRFSRRSQPWASSSYQWTSWCLSSIVSASTIRSVMSGTTRLSLRPWRISSGASIRSAAVDRRAAPEAGRAGRVVRVAHHPVQVEPAGPVAVAVALGDLRVAVQVDPRPPTAPARRRARTGPGSRRTTRRRPRAARPTTAGRPPSARRRRSRGRRRGPTRRRWPSRNVAAVAGRAAEVDVEDGEALADEDLLERQPDAEALARSGRRGGRRRRAPAAPPRLPVAAAGRNRLPSMRRPSRAVNATRSASRRSRAGRRTAGRLSVTWRGRDPSGATPRDGQQPEVLRSRARSRRSPPPRPRRPSSRPPARRPAHGSIRTPGAGAVTGPRVLRRPARGRAWPAAAAERRDDEVARPVVDLDVDEAASRPATAAGRSRSRRPARRARAAPVVRSVRSRQRRIEPDDLEPAVGVGQEEQPAVGQPARAALPGRARRRSACSVAGRDVDHRHGRPPAVVLALAGDGDPAAVGRPGEVLDVDPGRRSGRSARPASDGPPVDRAAAPGRRSARSATSRAGARRRRGAGPSGDQRGCVVRRDRLGDPDQARAVGVDDPDRVVADEGEPPAVGRPLRIGDRLLGGGQLDRDATAQRAGRTAGARRPPRRCRRPSRSRGWSRNSRGRIERGDSLDRQRVAGRSPRRRSGGRRRSGVPSRPGRLRPSDDRLIGGSAARRRRCRSSVVVDARLELVAELDRPAVGGPDRLRQDRPEPARLELVERRGAACRRAR